MPMVTLTCPICGTVFTTPLSQVRLRQRRCCSQACGYVLASHPRSAFWDRVEKTSTCWIWLGTVNAQGYGRWNHYGYAHRVSYAEAYGPLPDGLRLTHRCHRTDPTCQGGVTCRHRRCVRPDHLEPRSSSPTNVHGLVTALPTPSCAGVSRDGTPGPA